MKKGTLLATAVAAAFLISGCSESYNSGKPSCASGVSQSGSSSKLGKMGGSSCKSSCGNSQCNN